MTKIAKLSVELNLDDGSFTGKMTTAAGAVERLKHSVGDAHKSIERIEKRVTGFGASLRDLVLTISHLRGAFYTLYGVTGSWMGQIVKANAEMERLKALMRSFSSESTAALRQNEANSTVDSLRQMAKEMPQDLKTLTDAAVKFKSAGIDPMNGSLRALGDSVSAFGGTSDQFHRAAIAIQQMAGKGVVSMEELRQQLGEAVPTALKMMARSMGLSVGELVDKVSKGTVEARSAISKMMDEMTRTFGGEGQRLMSTFTGQVSLLRTNLNELVTTNAGMADFFAEIKKSVGDLNALLADPIVQTFATDLGKGLQDVTRFGREAVVFVVEFRREIMQLGTALTAIFVGRAVVGGVQALTLALAGASRATFSLQTVTTSYYAAAVGAAAIMNSKTMAAYRLAQAAGLAGAALRVMRIAVAGLLGPIGITIMLLYSLAEAMGLFSNTAENAAKDIENGLVTERAVEVVKDRIESIKKHLEDLRRQRDTATPGTDDYIGDTAMAKLDDQIRQLEEKLAGLQQTAQKGVAELVKRSAEKLVRDSEAALGDRMKNLQVEYEKSIEDIQRRREKLDKKDTAGRDALFKEQTEKMQSFFDGQVAIVDESIARQRQLMESGNERTREAAEQLYLKLRQQRQALIESHKAQLENFKRDNVFMASSKPTDAEKLSDRIEQRLARMKARAAELEDELAGGAGEVAKITALIDNSPEFKLITPEQRKALIDAAGELDRLLTAARDKKISTAALDSIKEKAANLAEQAAQVRDALQRGDIEADQGGLRSLISQLNKEVEKTIANSDQWIEATQAMTSALRDAANVKLGEFGLDMRAKAREMSIDLIENDKERIQKQLDMEIERVQKTIDVLVRHGADRKAIEKDVQAYIEALRAKAMRDQETAIERTAREWKNVSKQLEQAGAHWMGTWVDGIVEFARTGKFEFSKFAESVLADILRIYAQAQIAEAGSGILSKVTGFLGDMIGSAIGAGSGGNTAGAGKTSTTEIVKLHSGGIVGKDGASMIAETFAKARRFHSGGFPGLRSDEVPAVLQKGEGVFTAEQMKALGAARGTPGPVQVNVINQSGQQLEAKSQQRLDARGMVLDIVLTAAGQPGAFREGLKGALST